MLTAAQEPRPSAGTAALASRRARVGVTRLVLTDFRNYRSARLELDAGPVVVLTGPNGAGKTNLLEAMSFFSPGRGLRNARLSDVDRRDPTGGAATGPHRSDLAVVHADKGIAAEAASTGEQKALLIAILLAQAELQRAVRGEPPLLLLDEVAAHLDAPRRAALFDILAGLDGQAWLSGTDAAVFAPLCGAARFIAVHDGTLS
jgi:recombinational DNA repair ATPase RecF